MSLIFDVNRRTGALILSDGTVFQGEHFGGFGVVAPEQLPGARHEGGQERGRPIRRAGNRLIPRGCRGSL